MTVNLYKFDKKLNSTARPGNVDTTTFEVKLKTESSILTPVLQLMNKDFSWFEEVYKPYLYNYAYIESFGRWYFVTNWSFVNGFWEASLSVDVLASFKGHILESEQYVSRAADVTAEECGNIVDSTPLILSTSIRKTANGDAIYRSQYTDGFFIVGIISPNAAMGSTNYYLFNSASGLATFTSKLLSNADYLQASEVSDELMKCLVNPMQYITTCKFFPFPTDGLETTVEPVKLGFWDIGLSGERINNFSIWKESVIEIPKHPQMVSVGNFVNVSPYSNYTLQFEPFGNISLDSYALLSATQVTLAVQIDLVTGESQLNVIADNEYIVGRYYSQMAVDIPLSATTTSLLGIGAGIASGIIHDAVSQFGGSELASLATGVCSAISAKGTGVSTRGTQTTRSFMTGFPKLIGHFQLVSEEYRKKLGRALCKNVKLSTLTGFAMVVRPAVELETATVTEQEQIVRYMEGGFYIE